MKPLRWTNDADAHRYMKERQNQNLARSARNPNENWMGEKLATTGRKWRRQAQWGYRLFDFWCHELGIAVEVDGPEHRIDYDNHRDEYNYRRSAILVLRVRNQNEEDAAAVLGIIASSCTWSERRQQLGIDGHTKRARRRLVSGQPDLIEIQPQTRSPEGRKDR